MPQIGIDRQRVARDEIEADGGHRRLGVEFAFERAGHDVATSKNRADRKALNNRSGLSEPFEHVTVTREYLQPRTLSLPPGFHRLPPASAGTPLTLRSPVD